RRLLRMTDAALAALMATVVTALAATWTRRRHAPAPGAFREALRALLEVAGLAVVFLAADVALGVALVLGLRALGVFVSIYVMSDITLLLVALLQGVFFRAL